MNIFPKHGINANNNEKKGMRMIHKLKFTVEIDVDVVIDELKNMIDELKNNVHLDLILDCFTPEELSDHLHRKGINNCLPIPTERNRSK